MYWESRPRTQYLYIVENEPKDDGRGLRERFQEIGYTITSIVRTQPYIQQKTLAKLERKLESKNLSICKSDHECIY